MLYLVTAFIGAKLIPLVNLVERPEGLEESEGVGAGRLYEALPLLAQYTVVVLSRPQPLVRVRVLGS